ncbi:hypothetical protein BJV78DRAFT_241903 [Lactifluus subvellereus]|nr:hypothetical protein BJV78DRAFT_241903 [Lactifluus subvellereus]
MVYIPFASLLGLQAALNPFLSETKPESGLASVTVPFVNPTTGGGSLLDKDSGGLGEPLNVIISGLSSPWVLSDGGLVHFANAIGFGIECFGAHLGVPQTANLGDGHGWVNQTLELRNDYGNPDIGTCWESLVGGNHFRVFRQNGPSANTGALFLAVSEEENVTEGHTIKPNGYNLGRDSLVKSALGLKKYRGVKYQTTAQSISGMIPAGSTGINHGIAIDGVVTLLTVTIVP